MQTNTMVKTNKKINANDERGKKKYKVDKKKLLYAER